MIFFVCPILFDLLAEPEIHLPDSTPSDDVEAQSQIHLAGSSPSDDAEWGAVFIRSPEPVIP